jgi:hypothetical protein
MNTRICVLPTVLLVLGGCANTRETYTSEGKVGHVLDCSGWARSWAMCYEAAGDICGSKGYVVDNKSGDEGVVGSASSSGAFVGSVITRNMVIHCKE